DRRPVRRRGGGRRLPLLHARRLRKTAVQGRRARHLPQRRARDAEAAGPQRGLPAMSAEENVQRLIALTEQLTERMRQDADAFEARRPHEAAARIEETQQLANLFRYESDRVRQDPSLISAAAP